MIEINRIVNCLLFVLITTITFNGLALGQDNFVSKIKRNGYDRITIKKIESISNIQTAENSIYKIRFGYMDHSEARKAGVRVSDFNLMIVESIDSVNLEMLKKHLKHLKVKDPYKGAKEYIWGWSYEKGNSIFAYYVIYNITTRKVRIRFSDSAVDVHGIHSFEN